MSDTAILVDHLSKKYDLGKAYNPHDTLRDSITEVFSSSFHKLSSLFARNVVQSAGASSASSHWALKEVSFDVKQGEVIGIIGRNGAGKSTLLKILSRVTHPTSGYTEIHGRVGSLLEVGTGFHHELTGRENIYLSGAILGMKKGEIARKFDDMVEFSGVEKFIDTPVKQYSSGMYMRLAFAVAAHLEPEILIIDEVLAVGDLTFQKKCLGRMENVAKQGRTVVFVSHNMSAIRRLCSEAILLDEGRMALRGSTPDVVDHYLSSGAEEGAERIWQPKDLPDTCGPFRIRAVRVCDEDGLLTDTVRASQSFWIEIGYQITEPMRNLGVQIKLYTTQGDLLFISSDVDDLANHERHHERGSGLYVSRCRIPGHLLNKGTYQVGISVSVPYVQNYFQDEHAVRFTVDETDSAGNQWAANRNGFFRPALEWEVGPL